MHLLSIQAEADKQIDPYNKQTAYVNSKTNKYKNYNIIKYR